MLMPTFGKKNTLDFYVTLTMNLFGEENNLACKRENVRTSVVLATHTQMLKSKNERVWKLESRIRVTSYEVMIMYL